MKEQKNYKTKEAYNVLNTIFNLKKITPDGNLIVYKIDDFFDNKNLKNPIKEDEIIHDFQNWGVLKIEDKYVDDRDLVYYLKILPKFKKVYKDYHPEAPDIPDIPETNTFNVSNIYNVSNTYNNVSNTPNNLNKDNTSDTRDLKESHAVRHIRLSESQYLLEINNGERIIPFKSKKQKDEEDKKTKMFKILCHLWNYRTEFKNNKNIVKESDWVTIENLKRNSGCESVDATYKQIKRLEMKLKKNDLPIKIEAINEKYRLVITY